ncbi:MAG: type 1 glutamine amidotransferase domain-containing protein [Pseudomonadota bacterium]
MARVLITLTSHDRLGDTGRQTGFYFDEMAAPYWALRDAGHEVGLASIAGGVAPHDPTSLADDPAERPAAVTRFQDDSAAMAALSDTKAIADVDPADWDAIFVPGGHGTMWDLPDSDALAKAISAIYAKGGVVGAVCHGPAGLVGATKEDGRPLVEGKTIATFTDAEEDAVELTDVVPFALESRLRDLGATIQTAPNFEPNVVRDGRLVTGQNPASAEPVGKLLVEALADQPATQAAE